MNADWLKPELRELNIASVSRQQFYCNWYMCKLYTLYTCTLV